MSLHLAHVFTSSELRGEAERQELECQAPLLQLLQPKAASLQDRGGTTYNGSKQSRSLNMNIYI